MSRGDGLARLIAALEDHGCTVRGTSAQCPGHDDRDPSLSIGQGDKGAVLQCKAGNPGCPTDAILEVLGLSYAQLYDDCQEDRRRGLRRLVVSEYPYTDEDGTVLYVKVRYEPKWFAVRHPDGKGGWEWGIGKDTRRVLYQLPAVLAAGPAEVIWFTEGEKDAGALAAAGQAATCNHDGASGGWHHEYNRPLKGRDVLIVADKDPEGRAHARDVAAWLDGVAATCWIVEAAGDAKDAAEHLALGYGITDFVWWS